MFKYMCRDRDRDCDCDRDRDRDYGLQEGVKAGQGPPKRLVLK